MDKCSRCKSFLFKRRNALQESTKLPYTKEEKEMIYYTDRITDSEFENGSQICGECFEDLCTTISNEIPVSCEEIKQFLTIQLPIEKRNRENRRQKLVKGEKLVEIKSSVIEQEPSCKTCEIFWNQRKNYRFDKSKVDVENQTCGKCLEECQKNKLNNEYCRRVKAQKEVSDRDLEYRNLELKTKLLNMEMIKKKLQKK
jgi:hypothetical protein